MNEHAVRERNQKENDNQEEEKSASGLVMIDTTDKVKDEPNKEQPGSKKKD